MLYIRRAFVGSSLPFDLVISTSKSRTKLLAVFHFVYRYAKIQNGPQNTQTIMIERKTKTVYLIRHAESEENRRLGSLKLILMSMLLPWKRPWPTYQDVTTSLEFLKFEDQVDSDVSPGGLKQVSLFFLMFNKIS